MIRAVLFDQHSGRWIITVDDFNTRCYLAVSTTSSATGSWFKTNFVMSQGDDAGRWPDYPTLGVDANGIYVSAYMVGGFGQMSIFAVNKAPLVATPPSLGTVTAFRNLPWEAAINRRIPSVQRPGSTLSPPWMRPTCESVASTLPSRRQPCRPWDRSPFPLTVNPRLLRLWSASPHWTPSGRD